MLRLEGTVRLQGKVKWFNNSKGFGFITHASGRDVFVHYSQIQLDGFKSLREGEDVEYELIEGPKGLHALRVTRQQSILTESAPALLERIDEVRGIRNS